MEAIREILTVKNNRVTVELPIRFKNTEVEVIVLPIVSQEDILNAKREVMMASESSLGKDWNLLEEDKAWQNL